MIRVGVATTFPSLQLKKIKMRSDGANFQEGMVGGKMNYTTVGQIPKVAMYGYDVLV